MASGLGSGGEEGGSCTLRERQANRKGGYHAGAHCKVSLHQVGMLWALSQKTQTPQTGPCLLPLPHKFPPSVSPQLSFLPRYLPPNNPTYKTCLALTPVTYPWSGLPHRSQVGSGRCSGLEQSPDSPGGHTVETMKHHRDFY